MKKILTVLFITLMILTPCTKENETEDELKFREEYQSLNNKESDWGSIHKEVNIPKNNNIIYTGLDDICTILEEKKSAVVYFGFPECPWCRTALPVFLEVCGKEENMDVLYCNCHDERNEKEEINGEIVETKQGSENYYRFLEAIGEYAYAGDGIYEGEKRLYFPTFLIVKNGEILLYHISVLESYQDSEETLSTLQHDELYNIFDTAVKEFKSQKGCNLESKC